MSSLAQIRGLVSEFLVGSIEAKQLADRFEPLIEAAENSSDLNASNLAKQIELRIARFVDGYISEVSLRVQLNTLVPPPAFAPSVYVLDEPVCAFQPEAHTAVIPFASSGSYSLAFGSELPENQSLSLITV